MALLIFYTGSPYAVQNNFMAYGSFTIGVTLANYGEALSWCSSTAGLLMECADYTEICIHASDANTRVATSMYSSYNGTRVEIRVGDVIMCFKHSICLYEFNRNT